MTMPEPYRKRLPDQRPSMTTKRTVCGFELYITVSFYDGDDDRCDPAEVFSKLSKHGTEMSGLLDGFCIMVSLALQYGVPWKQVKDKFRHTRFGTPDYNKEGTTIIHSSMLDGLVQMVDACIEQRRRVIGDDEPETKPLDTGA